MKPEKYYDVPELRTLRAIIEYGTQRGQDKKQFMYTNAGGEVCTATFNQTWQRLRNLGCYLLGLGLEGKKIAILSENSYEWIVVYYAILASKNIAVPLDSKLDTDELTHQLTNCAVDGIFYSDKYADKVQALGGIIPAHAFRIAELPQLLEKGAALDGSAFDALQISPDDLACIVYTSGTTAKSKGVMLSHGNVASDVVASCRVMKGGHAIGFLPLNHTYSWVGALFSGYILAEWGYICPSLKTISDDIQTYHPQNFSAVPLVVETIYDRIWRTARKTGRDAVLKKGIRISRFLFKLGIDCRRKLFKTIHDQLGGNLELIVCGGAALDPAHEQFMQDIGITVINGYGITECSPAVTCNRVNNFKPGSVGLPLPCNEVKIHDPDEDGVGEIYVRGSNVMVGYYNDPEATAAAFDGDWLRTGDFGRMDEDGFLYFVGRKKNLIVLSNGKNVSPEELEDRLSRIPYVREVLVYEEERRITAEFFLDEEEPEARIRLKEDVRALNQTLPSFKQIQKTKIRDTEFPKTTTLKLIRANRDA